MTAVGWLIFRSVWNHDTRSGAERGLGQIPCRGRSVPSFTEGRISPANCLQTSPANPVLTLSWRTVSSAYCNEITVRILCHLSCLLTDNGHVHTSIWSCQKPADIARLLVESDRENFARPLEEWQTSSTGSSRLCFLSLLFELVRNHSMEHVYFKGKAKT